MSMLLGLCKLAYAALLRPPESARDQARFRSEGYTTHVGWVNGRVCTSYHLSYADERQGLSPGRDGACKWQSAVCETWVPWAGLGEALGSGRGWTFTRKCP